MTRINSAAFCHSVKMAPVIMVIMATTMAADLMAAAATDTAGIKTELERPL